MEEIDKLKEENIELQKQLLDIQYRYAQQSIALNELQMFKLKLDYDKLENEKIVQNLNEGANEPADK